MDEQLNRKVERAIKLIQSAGKVAKEHGQPLEVAYSGGKDSDVILELAKMAGVEYDAVYKCTTIDPPGTIKHVKEAGARMILPKKNFGELIAKTGFPTWLHRHCCGYLKEYKVLDVVLLGIRKSESVKRSKRYQEPTQCRVYSKKERVQQYFPILDWNDNDVLEFIEERNIKLHPIYYRENGTIDITQRCGCMCCPMQGERVRRANFKKYPNMLKFYLRNGRKFLQTHPNSAVQKYGDEYRWLVRDLFFRSDEVFFKRVGGGNSLKDNTLFDDAIDCKKFLEDYFGVKL